MIKFLFTMQPAAGPDNPSSFAIPQAKQGARWHYSPEEFVHVGGIKVPLAFIYLGTGLRTHIGDTEPSLIDPTLPVGKLVSHYTASSYLKSYHHLSPEERAGYLTWLANGRKRRDVPISWVLLFFSGLERQAIYDCMIDRAVTPPYPEIVSEVQRLLLLYGDDVNFNRNATNFLAYLELVMAGPAFEGEGLSLKVSHLFKAKISYAAQEGLPISAEVAYHWVSKLVKQQSVYWAGENLTQKGFFNKYNALSLRDKIPTWTKHQPHLTLAYTPVNSGLRGIMFNRNQKRMRDVFEVGEFQARLKNILKEVAKDLQAFNKEKSSQVKALMELPYDYWPASTLAVINHFKENPSYEVITWMTALTRLSLPPFSKEVPSCVKLLEKYGVNWYSQGQEVQNILYIGNGVGKEPEEVSLYGLALQALALMLGRALTENEFKQIVAEWELSEFEGLLLQDKLRSKSYKTIGPLLKQRELTALQKNRIAEFLATSQHLTESVPLKTLEKFTKAFGWTSSQTLSAHYGSRVPLHFSHAHPLCAETIGAVKQETLEVQQMLGAIFKEDIPEEVTTVFKDPLGLSLPESELLQDILKKGWTSASEFDTRGIMLGAFMDKVNEACMDNFGDILWEDSDLSCVNSDVAAAIGDMYE